MEAGIDQMTYLNHEGIPQREGIGDYFREVSLFRRHHSAVPLSERARSCMRFWMNRTNHAQYLLFYDNGKSACRVSSTAVPLSQHKWKLCSGARSATAIADPRHLDIANCIKVDDPCILHFPVCGLSWMQDKYSTLGGFADCWLKGGVRIPQCFHLDCRDAFLRGGPAELAKLYREQVMMDSASEAARQLEAGVCLRIAVFGSEISEPAFVGGGSPADSGNELVGVEKGWLVGAITRDFL